MADLRGRFVQWDPSDRGTQAWVDVIEPNDEEHRFRCLVLPDSMTELYGPPNEIEYLKERYGVDNLFFVVRMTTMYGPEN